MKSTLLLGVMGFCLLAVGLAFAIHVENHAWSKFVAKHQCRMTHSFIVSSDTVRRRYVCADGRVYWR